MKASSFFGGAALSALAIGPLVVAAIAVRRRWFPTWAGSHARVVEAVTVLASLTLTGEALGVVGLFRRWILVSGCLLCGVVLWAAARHGAASAPAAASSSTPHDSEAEEGEPTGGLGDWSRASVVVAVVGVALVAIQWIAVTVQNLRVGMQSSYDTVWYHGPMAANFVQDASITRIHYFDGDPITAFYPGGSELLHAVGIAFFGDDVLSPIINLSFLALAVLAAWSIGRSLGSAPASVLGVLLVLGTPAFVRYQPGGGYTDVVGVALVLAAVALLLRGKGRGPALVLAAIAGGLAVGTKFTMLAPVGALAVGVVLVSGRGSRVRALTTWVVAVGVMGGVWFVRNLVSAENPLPGLSFSLGPISLPPLHTAIPLDHFADYLTDWNVVRHVYIPGWSQTMGHGWWGTMAGAVIGGLVVAFRGRGSLARVVGAVAVVTFGAFLVTPQYLASSSILFTQNVRYAAPAFALGLVVLSALPVTRTRVGARGLLVALSILFVLTQIRASELWLPTTRDVVVAAAVLAGTALAAFALFQVRQRAGSSRFTVALVTALVLATTLTWALQRDYRSNRYRDDFYEQSTIATLSEKRDVRIADSGLVLKYPLYGPDLSNRVVYVGQRGDHGSFAAFTSCTRWKQFLNRGHYDFVLIWRTGPEAEHFVRERRWAGSDVALQPVAQGVDATTYEVTGRLDPEKCP